MCLNPEVWKPIEFGNGRYEVSSHGRVKSFYKTEKILKSGLSQRYPFVSLHFEGNSCSRRVHVLVVWAFMGNFNSKTHCVDHIDGDRTNNCLENLRIVTHSENQRASRKSSGSTSEFRGVRLDKARKSKNWLARIQIDGKSRYIGRFETEKEAALAYNKKAIEIGFLPQSLNKID